MLNYWPWELSSFFLVDCFPIILQQGRGKQIIGAPGTAQNGSIVLIIHEDKSCISLQVCAAVCLKAQGSLVSHCITICGHVCGHHLCSPSVSPISALNWFPPHLQGGFEIWHKVCSKPNCVPSSWVFLAHFACYFSLCQIVWLGSRFMGTSPSNSDMCLLLAWKLS